MEDRVKRQLAVGIHPSADPQIGRWLWALQECRRRTIEDLGVPRPAVIDWRPGGGENGIGTVLYHIAAIEADWLYEEVLEQPFPPEAAALFPFDIRDAQGRLTPIEGISLGQHRERLVAVRHLLLDVYERMELSDFRRVRSLPDYDVTPEWVLYHLMQHEAQHRSQIIRIRRAAAEHGLAPT